MSETSVVMLVELIVKAVLAMSFGLPLLSFYLRRKEARPPKGDPQLEARLTRMETTLDSIAVELERISEGQRFTTKLMAEREQVKGSLPLALSGTNSAERL